ncbi:MAG: methylenetetrahydrofolate--tRNA-(uracil(54)-C(5))-methyltransferase (FADH(2)-oxidizing) TrmFO [Clostridia bacterium]|nr:methylenetetrahydrofolate--tRNA-(uracil(54)-C(5))-methyltransferase (FADH(2)-oxidizing) TrmFO [Clostridia bacterium]
MKNKTVKVIGGGLAGSECALQLAKRGYKVILCDMKPLKKSPAHHLDTLCELVCSNSLKSTALSTGSGVLKKELELLGSEVLKLAYESSVPAGHALAVEREKFSRSVHQKLVDSGVEIRAEVVDNVNEDEITVIATGPLTDSALEPAIEKISGKRPYFFDAAAPIVTGESIDMQRAFFGGRYGKGGDDYPNLPMSKEEYLAFYNELIHAECAPVKDFEGEEVFEGCMPVEVMAKRGEDTLRYGPLRPVGFGRREERPYAVLQLRREDREGKLFNLVGFQTHLKFPEQKRVFSLIPGLKEAEFVRYGVMHRNTYIKSPDVVDKNLAVKNKPNVYFAGQITGVEGYMESVMSGLCVALSVSGKDKGFDLDIPLESVTGSLINYVTQGMSEEFQPVNANFGILPALAEKIKDKEQRKIAYADRAINAMTEYVKWRNDNGI